MVKTAASTAQKIKQRAYWQVEFFPIEFIEKAIGTHDIANIVSHAAVQYRGWDYPHIVTQNIDDRQEGYLKNNSYYESWVDWSVHKELWRVHKSGKFTHLSAIFEQWFDEYETLFATNQYQDLEHNIIDVVNVILQVTEIIEFISGFARSIGDANNFVLRLKIKNAEDNKLVILDKRRMPLRAAYKNRSETIVGYDGQVNKQSLADKNAREALEDGIIQTIYGYFDGWQWSNESIAAERLKLMERHL